jgi:hypothetical protein
VLCACDDIASVMMTGCGNVQDANQSQTSQDITQCELDCPNGQVFTCTTVPCSVTGTSLTCNGVVTSCPSQQICTPGDVRTCCAFSGGCGCLGDQTCNSTGLLWARASAPHPGARRAPDGLAGPRVKITIPVGTGKSSRRTCRARLGSTGREPDFLASSETMRHAESVPSPSQADRPIDDVLGAHHRGMEAACLEIVRAGSAADPRDLALRWRRVERERLEYMAAMRAPSRGDIPAWWHSHKRSARVWRAKNLGVVDR